MQLTGLVFSEKRGVGNKTQKPFVTLSVIDQGPAPRYPRSIEVCPTGEFSGESYEGKRIVVYVTRIDKNFDGSIRVGGEVGVAE